MTARPPRRAAAVQDPPADLLRPGLRVVLAGTRDTAPHEAAALHWYAGRGTSFWVLLHAAGLTPQLLSPERDEQLLEHGIGLADLRGTRGSDRGAPTRWHAAAFDEALRQAAPGRIAFVSRSAATAYARARSLRAPRGYGPTAWPVAGRPGFVLPGPSGANNGMPLPVRIALWRDLTDALLTDAAAAAPAGGPGTGARRT